VLREMALIGFRFNPIEKKFGARLTAARFIKTDMPDVVGIG